MYFKARDNLKVEYKPQNLVTIKILYMFSLDPNQTNTSRLEHIRYKKQK